MSGVRLEIAGLAKRYGEIEVLKALDLDVEAGAFAALLGPSGCGKSTLLRIVAGLDAPSAGSVRLGGEDLSGMPPWRRDIGVVFQSYALFPHLSVAENVRFGLDMRKLARPEAEERVREALALVRLDGLARRMPADLSGGQQQRVAIARALAIRPRLLLLDEPLSNLDAVLRKSVRVEIRELHERAGITTVMVTHDQEEAMSMADRVAVMEGGRVEQWDAPEAIFERPATRFVAGFVGSPAMNLLTLRRRLDGAWQIGEALFAPEPALAAALASAGRIELVLGLRPERLHVAEPGLPEAMEGIVRSCEYLGGSRLVHVEAGGQRLAVVVEGPAPAIGARLALRPQPGAALLFDPATGTRIDRP